MTQTIAHSTYFHTPSSVRKDLIRCGEYIVDLSGWWDGEAEVIIYTRDRNETVRTTSNTARSAGNSIHTLAKTARKNTLSC